MPCYLEGHSPYDQLDSGDPEQFNAAADTLRDLGISEGVLVQLSE